MVEVYCTLIINKKRTFDNVPDTLKDAVEERLSEQGYNTDGDLIADGV